MKTVFFPIKRRALLITALLTTLSWSTFVGPLAAASPMTVSHGFSTVGVITRVSMEVDVPRTKGGSKLDILFVIDDSGSMAVHQKNLLNNIDGLVDASLRSGVNLHVGVISTSVDWPPAGGVAGGLIGSGQRFADSSSPIFKSDLKNNLQQAMTINGSGLETPFDAVTIGLSEPTASKHNPGFRRADAGLAIVILTDADDQSKVDAQGFVDFLRNSQAGAAVIVYAAYLPSKLGRSPGRECNRDTDGVLPTKIEEVLTLFGTLDESVDLCDAQFASRFSKLGEGLAVIGLRQIQLELVPDISTLNVRYGSVLLPPNDVKMGWTYDSKKRSIILGDAIDWEAEPVGTRLMIDYIEKGVK